MRVSTVLPSSWFSRVLPAIQLTSKGLSSGTASLTAPAASLPGAEESISPKEFVTQANEMGDKKAEFVFEVKNMYTLGELGVPLAKAVKSGYADNISSVMQEFGWWLGRRVYDTQVQKAEANKKANAAAQKASASVSGQNVNGVQYDGLTVKRGSGGDVEIEDVTLNEQQSASIRAAEMLAQIGVNIHVFQSQTDANGNPVGDNGSYSTRDGSIHIDLNAGNMGQGVMAYTLSHEFTHFMEQQSPAMFQRFTDSLFSELDTDIEAEIVSKAETLKQQRPEQYKGADNGKLMQDARSEVVAEASGENEQNESGVKDCGDGD